MNMREYIRICCVKCGNVSEAELARRTNQTPQNMNNKYKRNTFKISELEKIAEALGTELYVRFVDKKTKKPIETAENEVALSSNAVSSPISSISVSGDIKSLHNLLDQLSKNISFPSQEGYNADTSAPIPLDVNIELS